MKQHVADVMSPGDHGSTFAGNPLVCAAANATFDIIAEPAFLADVERKGERLRGALRDACGDNAHVQVRSHHRHFSRRHPPSAAQRFVAITCATCPGLDVPHSVTCCILQWTQTDCTERTVQMCKP